MIERQAIERLQRGDIGGLEELVRAHQLAAVRAAYLICRDPAQAEDIVQSAFLKVFARIDQFDASRPFAPWFMRLVANDALKAASRSARTQALANDYDVGELAIASPDPDLITRLEALETSAALRAALDQLAPADRHAIVLRYFLDLDSTAMAARLDSTPSTIRWRLASARRKLRQLLPEWVAPENASKGETK